MKGKLVRDGDRLVCVSCFRWNCWHSTETPCDIEGCECTVGNKYHKGP